MLRLVELAAARTGIMQLLRRSNAELGVTIRASYGQRVMRVVDGRIAEDIDVGATPPRLSVVRPVGGA